MKRFLSLFLCLILVTGCIACGESEKPDVEPTTPEATTEEPLPTEPAAARTPAGYALFGTPLGDLTADELKDAMAQLAEDYVLNVTLDDTTFPLSGAAIGVAFDDTVDYEAAVSGSVSPSALSKHVIVTADDDKIIEAMVDAYTNYLQVQLQNAKAAKEQSANSGTSSDAAVLTDKEIAEIEDKVNGVVDGTSARISYSSSEKKYVGVDGKPGETWDYTAVVPELRSAAQNMAKEVTVHPAVVFGEGEKAATSEAVQRALENANSYLTLNISYSFNSPGGKSGSFSINSGNVNEYLYVGSDGRSIHVNSDSLTRKAASLADSYSDVTTTKTTEGDTVTTVRKGWQADSNQIYSNLKDCLDSRKSGSFTAVYKEINETTQSKANGGTYVHVDLDAQMVYLYVNGVCIVSSPCVSGKVSEKHWTVNGEYSIYSKELNRTLHGRNSDGSTYASFVQYWMPFFGGQGLHDADGWRSSYGGDIYIWSGSHGCVNLPTWAAKKIYENVSVGTKVILTGGLRSIPSTEQQISVGSSSYKLPMGSPAFNLNASCLGGAVMNFSSSNDSVASVSSNGTVSINGIGSATITVTTQPAGSYKLGTKRVSVNVYAPKHEISAPSSFDKSIDDGGFDIGASCKTGHLIYFSDSSSIAKVDASGHVTIKAPGTATISVIAPAESYFLENSVYVTVNISARSQSISTQVGTTVSAKTGDGSFNIGASCQGGVQLTYSSSDDSVAAVDSDGSVTIVGAGTAYITISAPAQNGYESKALTVTVNVEEEPSSSEEPGSEDPSTNPEDPSGASDSPDQSGPSQDNPVQP
ncbi:MAG: L,D-transpeptidase family protein [Lachnospiraceae bacterium]|nr:L,D-transpeptidase family protein [Lachnospiraceae bacterium]